ncbi:MAG: hypothetical protein ACRC3J_09125 [Culicoidibacterales bacterium]
MSQCEDNVFIRKTTAIFGTSGFSRHQYTVVIECDLRGIVSITTIGEKSQKKKVTFQRMTDEQFNIKLQEKERILSLAAIQQACDKKLAFIDKLEMKRCSRIRRSALSEEQKNRIYDSMDRRREIVVTMRMNAITELAS